MEPKSRQSIASERAPAPGGPYSPGIRTEGLVFVSGQVGVDPVSGKPADGVAAQTELALRHVDSILQEGGSSLAHALRLGVFLANLGDFSTMNAVYERLVPEPRPVRTTVEVGLAPGLAVEIDAIGLVPR